MGKLYDLRVKIEKIIEERGMDVFKTKGAIGLRSGLLVNFINPDTPDDDEKFEKLKIAVKEVLNVSI